MRKTNALYKKTQRLIAETHRGIKGHTETHTKTQRETHTERHIQRAASEVNPSFCYTHES